MKKMAFLLVILSLLLAMAACGGGTPHSVESSFAGKQTLTASAAETTAAKAADTTAAATTSSAAETKAVVGTELKTALFTLTYPDGWAVSKDDVTDMDSFCSAKLVLKDGETDVCSIYLQSSIEDKDSFRGYLDTYEFDAKKLVEKNAYSTTKLGGVDCYSAETTSWGDPEKVLFGRVPGAQETVYLTMDGTYSDPRVETLLSTLQFHGKDTGKTDPPWPWQGVPYEAEDHEKMVGTYRLKSHFLKNDVSYVTPEIFNIGAAAFGDKVYLTDEKFGLQTYRRTANGLSFEGQTDVDGDYYVISSTADGTLYLSSFLEPLTAVKDGAVTAAWDDDDISYVAMHPSGTWGISYFSEPDCLKVTISDGKISKSAISFPEVDLINHLLIDNNHIYVAGSEAGTNKHTVYVYDLDGKLQLTLRGSDGALGSVTFVTETKNGYLALDANMREVVLWDKDGALIGSADDGDLFGTDYPWFCCGVPLDDGSILAVMTDERPDESSNEVLVFQLTGF